ncbi:hypothetical protein BJX70DRAFT_365011 [Aspergillus crustosus]
MVTRVPIKTLLTRTIHVKIRPPPRNLGDSRLVLAQLQKFGEVVAFHNMGYKRLRGQGSSTRKRISNNCFALFESPTAAQAAIEASPLEIQLPTSSSSSAPFSGSESTSDTSSSFKASWNPNPTYPIYLSQKGTPPPTTMTCVIEHSDHNHYANITRNPFFSRFNPDLSSPIAQDLYLKLGNDMKGLADTPMARKVPEPLDRIYGTLRGLYRMGGGSLMDMYKAGLTQERPESRKAKQGEGGEEGEKGEKGWQKKSG